MAIINKLAKAAVGTACATLLAGVAAQADDNFSYAFTITGASDYMFRGVSYTQNDPTINSYVELDYNTNSLLGTAYLGFWTSNIDTGDADDALPGYGLLGPWEQDIYAGIRPVTGPINWDLGALWYIYGVKSNTPGIGTSDYDYVEFKVNATTSPITNLTLGITGYYTPDQDLATPETETIEGAIYYTLPQCWIFTPTIGGIVGWWHFEDSDLYPGGYFVADDGSLHNELTYWNAGVKLVADRFFMDFRYWDTTLESQFADERVVFSAGVNLAP